MIPSIKKIWNKVADNKPQKIILLCEAVLFLIGLIIFIASIITVNIGGIAVGLTIMIMLLIIIVITVLLCHYVPGWTHCCTKVKNLPVVTV